MDRLLAASPVCPSAHCSCALPRAPTTRSGNSASPAAKSPSFFSSTTSASWDFKTFRSGWTPSSSLRWATAPITPRLRPGAGCAPPKIRVGSSNPPVSGATSKKAGSNASAPPSTSAPATRFLPGARPIRSTPPTCGTRAICTIPFKAPSSRSRRWTSRSIPHRSRTSASSSSARRSSGSPRSHSISQTAVSSRLRSRTRAGFCCFRPQWLPPTAASWHRCNIRSRPRLIRSPGKVAHAYALRVSGAGTSQFPTPTSSSPSPASRLRAPATLQARHFPTSTSRSTRRFSVSRCSAWTAPDRFRSATPTSACVSRAPTSRATTRGSRRPRRHASRSAA